MPRDSLTLALDLDGTLIDNSIRHHWAYSQSLKELGYPSLPLAEYWKLKRRAIAMPRILSYTAPIELYPAFRRYWFKMIENEKALTHDQLFPDAISALRQLSHQFELVLITARRNRSGLIKELKHFSLDKYFSLTLSSYSETTDKTDGDVTKEMLLQGASFQRTLIAYVGDADEDIVAAQSLGLVAVAVASGIRDLTILSKYKPDILCQHIGEIPKALYGLLAPK